MREGSRCPGPPSFWRPTAGPGKFIWESVLRWLNLMEIHLTAKNLSATERIKSWVFEKVGKFEKYSPRLVESHVILKKEKYLYVAEVTLLGGHLYIVGEGRDKESLFTAIDQACDRVAVQLKKFREKLKGHHLDKGGKD